MAEGDRQTMSFIDTWLAQNLKVCDLSQELVIKNCPQLPAKAQNAKAFHNGISKVEERDFGDDHANRTWGEAHVAG